MNSISQKKKILYVITKSNLGGASRYIFDLASSFKDENEVTVAFGGTGILQTQLEAIGIRTIPINNLGRDVKLFNDIRVFFELIKIFSKENADIIHLNSSKIGGLGALAGRLARIQNKLKGIPSHTRIIFTAHGWAFKESRSALSQFFIQIISFITVFLCDKTIVVSADDKLRSSHFPFVQDKIHLVYNGIPAFPLLPKDAARKELLSTQTPPPENAVWIGSIGELHTNKGYDFALEGLSELTTEDPTLHLMYAIIGSGEEEMRLKEKAIRLGIQNFVYFAGSKNNASSFLSAFDIFLMTSIKEGLPYAILEAGRAGLPVIATSVGGIPEIVDDMNSGIIIRHGEPREIKDALKYLITRPADQKTFAAELQKKVMTQFSLEQSIAGTKKVYAL
jgi:glycosyltransferase involved in cell wall biosynthesis